MAGDVLFNYLLRYTMNYCTGSNALLVASQTHVVTRELCSARESDKIKTSDKILFVLLVTVVKGMMLI